MLQRHIFFLCLFFLPFLSAMQLGNKPLGELPLFPIKRQIPFQGYIFFALMPDLQSPYKLCIPASDNTSFIFLYARFKDNRQVCSFIDNTLHKQLLVRGNDDLLGRAIGFIQAHEKPENEMLLLQCTSIVSVDDTMQVCGSCNRIENEFVGNIKMKKLLYQNSVSTPISILISSDIHTSCISMNSSVHFLNFEK